MHYRHQLTNKLGLIHEASLLIFECKEFLAQPREPAPGQFGQEGFINGDEVGRAAEYEERVTKKAEKGQLDLRIAEESYQQRVKNFLEWLPSTIVKQMREGGDMIHAQWVMEDTSQIQLGPYAAYFVGDELTVEKYKNYEELFQHQRERKRQA